MTIELDGMRLFVALAGVVVALGGCEVSVEPLCSGVDCSGHGECVVRQESDGARPWCQCDEGYMTTPDGLECYRQGGPPPDADTGR